MLVYETHKFITLNLIYASTSKSAQTESTTKTYASPLLPVIYCQSLPLLFPTLQGYKAQCQTLSMLYLHGS